MEMDEALRSACAITFSEFNGHTFNQSTMRFEEQK